LRSVALAAWMSSASAMISTRTGQLLQNAFNAIGCVSMTTVGPYSKVDKAASPTIDRFLKFREISKIVTDHLRCRVIKILFLEEERQFNRSAPKLQ